MAIVAMKTGNRERFDIETLRELSGERSFVRGKDYFRDGCVQILSLGSKRVVAEVSGTQDYRTMLTGRGEDIGGECSCPAFEDQGFCKHMVATALAVNAAGDGAKGEAGAALSRIREHLKAKPADQLVEIILDLAEQYPEFFHKLDTESALVRADDAMLETRLRKAIDAATRTSTYVDYRAARSWRAGVEAVLDTVADIIAWRGHVALSLAEHAIERIGQTFESIDDSDGHLGSLLGQARDIHLAAAEVARPEPIALARNLFKRAMEDDFGAFGDVLTGYAEVLGKPGLAEYRRLAEAAWKKVPGRPGRARAADDDPGAVHQLIPILDFFAEQDGDVEARIALRANDLASQWDYLQLAEFCLSQGRKEEALRRAEEGLWQFEDDQPDERLLAFVAKQLTIAKRKADAEAILWQAFQKAPSLNIYNELRSVGGEAASARALSFIESRLVGKQRQSWRERPDLFVEMLMLEKRFDAAWSIVQKFGASEHAMQSLVAASDTEFPRQAIEFYAAQVERFANAAVYPQAVKVIARMAKLRSADEQAVFLAGLKARHGRKRNFMKLLGE